MMIQNQQTLAPDGIRIYPLTTMTKNLVVDNWDAAYLDGKYDEEGPISFVQDIIQTIEKQGLKGELGFYPGCGNGRNLIPLLEAGLKIEGKDISPVAIEKLKRRYPEADATVGDFMTHQVKQPYAFLLSIQLFQHGNYETVKKLFQKSDELLCENGLFILRVNSIHTQISQKYEVIEVSPQGGFTVVYQSGDKEGQEIHFYTAEEICTLTRTHEIVLPLREVWVQREDGTYWAQWETILKKK